MKPAILLASPIVRKRLAARKTMRALKSLDVKALSPVDRAFLRLALEVFSKDERGKALAHIE